jgi:plasmid stabilization system protein ParE
MNVRKSDEFIADVERQFEWYDVHAGSEIAERYLAAVEATCQLLGHHPR